MSIYYILSEDKTVKTVAAEEWSAFYETKERFLGRTEIGDIQVSTVFLGLDHRFGEGPPILFETMIFGGPEEIDNYQERYCTYDQAMLGHDTAVEMARESKAKYDAISEKARD